MNQVALTTVICNRRVYATFLWLPRSCIYPYSTVIDRSRTCDVPIDRLMEMSTELAQFKQEVLVILGAGPVEQLPLSLIHLFINHYQRYPWHMVPSSSLTKVAKCNLSLIALDSWCKFLSYMNRTSRMVRL